MYQQTRTDNGSYASYSAPQTRTDNGSYASYSAPQFKPRGYPPAAEKQRFAVSAPSFSPYFSTAPAHGTRMSNADQTQSFMKFTGNGGSQQPPAASNMQRIGNPVTTPNSRTFIPTNSTNRGLSSNSTTFKPRTNLNSTSTTFRPQRTANATPKTPPMSSNAPAWKPNNIPARAPAPESERARPVPAARTSTAFRPQLTAKPHPKTPPMSSNAPSWKPSNVPTRAPAPAPAPAKPVIPALSDAPMSSEDVAALMAEKRRVNNARRKEQSARNAAIEARLANPDYTSDNNPYANTAPPQPMPQSQPQHSTQNASQQQPPLPGGMDVSGMDVMQPSSSFFDPMNCSAARPPTRTVRSMFMRDDFREYFHRQAMTLHMQVPPDDDLLKAIPKSFSNARRLDYNVKGMKRVEMDSFNYPTTVFKVVSDKDGYSYALRRVDKIKTTVERTTDVLRQWERVALSHPNIVTLRSIFVANQALFFLHDYFPAAQTLRQLYLEQRTHPIPERTLWTMWASLVNAVAAVHASNMALRCCNPTRILMTGNGRARFNCVGVMDVLDFENKQPMQQLQREDLAGLGKTFLMLCCRSLTAASNPVHSIKIVNDQYSSDMSHLIWLLMDYNKPNLAVMDVIRMTSHRVATIQLEHLYSYTDSLESVLEQQLENGRLLSLMIKLGMVSDRPSDAQQWRFGSQAPETGRAFVLKLLRDYLFHQVDGDGQPVTDIGHIISGLNKLDVGVEEKLLLSTRDNRSLLVASFKDMKTCVQEAFKELLMRSAEGGMTGQLAFKPVLYRRP